MSLLPEHSHCLNCDDPVEEGQEYCSEECRLKVESDARKERNKNYFLYGMIAVVLIAVSLLVTLG
jgi:predicted nucleic acid-binding Zn ribbon protein